MKYILIKIIQSLVLILVSKTVLSQNEKSKIALSFDDPTTKNIQHFQNKVCDSLILNTLKKNNIKSILFVCGMRLNSSQGSELLSRWNTDDHLIANHTFSHINYNSEIKTSSLENFKTDFLQVDSVIKSYSNYTKLFRFPYLKESNTPEKINSFREFLTKNNYKKGYDVSIDASYWHINNRLINSLTTNPNRSLEGYRDVYLQLIFERALFCDQLAKEVLNRPVKNVLLLHHNLTSALFLDDLIQHFKKKGGKIITPEEAYEDLIYDETPNIIPTGESIWAKAKESGKLKHTLRYPAEDGRYEKEKINKIKLQ